MAVTTTMSNGTETAPVLITGAGGGVGSRLAEVLLESGYRGLLFHYRRRSEAIRQVLLKYDVNPEQSLFCAELTHEEEVQQMHMRIYDTYGPLYGLLNVAGSSTNAMSWKLSKQDFQEVIDSNLLTTFLCCRQFIPEMREQGRGRIINISSVVGFTGVAGAAHYCAAKAGVAGFTKALAVELAPRNIVVSAVALGYFDFGLIHSIPPEQKERLLTTIPARRFGSSCELSGLVQYLLSEAGAYSGGQVYHLNGGSYS